MSATDSETWSGDQLDEEDRKPSKPCDLCTDFEELLYTQNLQFPGYFYHAALQPTAPNPCLKINNLGLLGLPLNKREAMALVSVASPILSEQQNADLMNESATRPTCQWKIEPDDIEFGNPLWATWIEGVCKEVCARLGVNTKKKHLPKMELRKIQLDGEGSNFLSQQNKETPDHSFATVVVVLPSEYLGGQVTVTHSTTTRTIDFASESLSSTTVFAWYDGTSYKASPITSGYRLALLYGLVKVDKDFVPSNLPNNVDITLALERIMREWQKDTDRTFACLLLDHNYGAEALKQGEMCLCGIDRQRAAMIRDVADSLGLLVGLATIEHYQMGIVRDNEDLSRYVKRRRLTEDDSNDWAVWGQDLPEFDSDGYEECTGTCLLRIVDYDGKALFEELDTIKISTEMDLIPSEPFYNMKPNGHEIWDTPDLGTTVTYFYRRTVVCILPTDDTDEFCWSQGGAQLAMNRLKMSSLPPSPRDRRWLIRILDGQKSPYAGAERLTGAHVRELTRYALAWKDSDIWKRLMRSWDCSHLGEIDYLVSAWGLFGFENISSSLEENFRSATRTDDFKNIMELIYGLPEHAKEEKDVVLAWCQKQSDQLLSSFHPVDASSVITCLQYANMHSFKILMLPNMLRNPDRYEFWLGLAVSLRTQRSQIIGRQTEIIKQRWPLLVQPAIQASTPEEEHNAILKSEEDINSLAIQCLQLAAPKWFIAIPSTQNPANTWGSRSRQKAPPVAVEQAPKENEKTVDRVVEILDESIAGGYSDISRKLFVEILTSPGTSKAKFVELYIPLIKRMCELLQEHNCDISSPPFIDLFQVLIATYLRDILGSKSESRNNYLRKISCGCATCAALDEFMLDLDSNLHTFRLPQQRRDHLELLVAGASDLCTFQIIRTGTPYGLEVTKRPEVVLKSTWDARVEGALEFLKLIGPDEVIEKIMGGRYVDVQNAIAGEQAFASSKVPESKDTNTA